MDEEAAAMTDLEARLNAIRERRAAITRLPWKAIATGEWPGGIVSKRVDPQTGNLPQIGAFDDDANNEFAAHAPEDITWLIGEVEEAEQLKDRLRELEWSGDPNHGRDHCPVCPACTGYRPETDDEPGVGHTDDCWLAAAIGST